jgi:hypothetical protein
VKNVVSGGWRKIRDRMITPQEGYLNIRGKMPKVIFFSDALTVKPFRPIPPYTFFHPAIKNTLYVIIVLIIAALLKWISR